MSVDTDIAAAELEELSDGSETTLHSHVSAGESGGGTTVLFPWFNESSSGGAWTFTMDAIYLFGGHYYSTAEESEIHFSTFLGKGTYTLKMLSNTDTWSSIVDIYIDASEVASFDLYAESEIKNVVNTQTSIVVTSSGVKDIKVVKDGKNASSGGWRCKLQALTFYRTE